LRISAHDIYLNVCDKRHKSTNYDKLGDN
jgi:hypothetical protein